MYTIVKEVFWGNIYQPQPSFFYIFLLPVFIQLGLNFMLEICRLVVKKKRYRNARLYTEHVLMQGDIFLDLRFEILFF